MNGFKPSILIGLALLAGLIARNSVAELRLSDSAETPRVEARLLSSLAVAAPGSTVSLALHQEIIDGWHTYWKNPGDSGEPIDIAWRLPDGVTAGELHYPVPQAISVGPLMNYGYSDEAIVLADIEVPVDWRAGRVLQIDAQATWLVCEVKCIPEEATFSLSIPTGDSVMVNHDASPLFERAGDELPRAAPWPVSARENGDSYVITVEGIDRETSDDVYFFPLAWGHVAHAARQEVALSESRLELTLVKGEAPPGDRLEGLLRIGEAAYPVTARIEPAAAFVDSPGIVALLLLAFAGGVLLNLMPCVFPVLAMKAVALIRHAEESGRERAAGGAAYLLGVVLSFVGLAAVLLIVRAGGEAVQEALQAAYDADIYLVAAAGNHASGQVTWPAASPLVVAVGATARPADGLYVYYRDLRMEWEAADYSNLGAGVEVMAPGGSIHDDMDGDGYVDGILAESIHPDDPTQIGYWLMAGTSQASAVVSGLAVPAARSGVPVAEWRRRLASQASYAANAPRCGAAAWARGS